MNSYFIQALKDRLPRQFLSKIGLEKKLLKRKKSSKVSCLDDLILSKFEATLLGSLIGDCIGKRVESIWGPNLSDMLDEFRELREKVEGDAADSEYDHETDFVDYDEANIKEYTDDTALTMALCDSLLSKGDFDLVDIADHFQSTYANNPSRGYSSCAIVLFKKLNKFKYTNELNDRCLLPAMEVFNGEGSFGNGGGKLLFSFLFIKKLF